jgi:hypothetical protein
LCAAGTTSKNKKKKGSKDWSKVNFDDVEKEWEGGDDEEELEYEHERVEKLIEKKKASQSAFDPNDPSSMKRHLNNMKKGGGKDNTEPKMMFITLKRETPKGVLWTKELLDDLAARWTALVQTASLSADFYNLGGKTPEEQTLMVPRKTDQKPNRIRYLVVQTLTHTLPRTLSRTLPRTRAHKGQRG